MAANWGNSYSFNFPNGDELKGLRKHQREAPMELSFDIMPRMVVYVILK